MPSHQLRNQRKESGVVVSEFKQGYQRALGDIEEFLDAESQRADIVITAMQDGGVEMPDDEEGNVLVAAIAAKATLDALSVRLKEWKR